MSQDSSENVRVLFAGFYRSFKKRKAILEKKTDREIKKTTNMYVFVAGHTLWEGKFWMNA